MPPREPQRSGASLPAPEAAESVHTARQRPTRPLGLRIPRASWRFQPTGLGDISDLKRCNVAKLPLDEASLPVMEKMKMICLKADGGMFWDAKGRKMEM